MPHIALHRVLSYSQEQLFELVADIEAYPEFLPWCDSAKIVRREGEQLWADLAVGYKNIAKHYQSRVLLDKPNYRIRAELESGPLSHLDQTWQFIESQGEGTEIIFDIDFGFHSALLTNIMFGISKTLADSMMQAFIRRADKLYGWYSV